MIEILCSCRRLYQYNEDDFLFQLWFLPILQTSEKHINVNKDKFSINNFSLFTALDQVLIFFSFFAGGGREGQELWENSKFIKVLLFLVLIIFWIIEEWLKNVKILMENNKLKYSWKKISFQEISAFPKQMI